MTENRDLKELNDKLVRLRDEIAAQGDNVDPALAAEFTALWLEGVQEIGKVLLPVIKKQWELLQASITATHSYLVDNGIIESDTKS